MRTISALALMLVAPPVLLLLRANLIPPHDFSSDVLGMVLIGAVGLAGVATAPWPVVARAITALAYIGLLVFTMPFMGLAAACSTGNCL